MEPAERFVPPTSFTDEQNNNIVAHHWIPGKQLPSFQSSIASTQTASTSRTSNWLGIVFIMHGLAEHAGCHERLALRLLDLGFSVHAIDYPGQYVLFYIHIHLHIHTPHHTVVLYLANTFTWQCHQWSFLW
jgi:hypothetical protein